jgi:TldD protein
MPNVSLAPGNEPYSVDQMIKDVEKGIYIAGRGSYSIDQQRYNFQCGGTVFYEIKDGKIAGMLNDVAYQSNTQEFWNSCVKICDEKDYRMFGSFFDGKGQPSQVSAVSHVTSARTYLAAARSATEVAATPASSSPDLGSLALPINSRMSPNS